jgi:hypothetical protein
MSETDATTYTRKRPRSPSYPAINLETALQRARQLYAAENVNAAPIDAILADWNYSPGSGAGLVSIAALKKFGLLEDEGSGKNRTAKLTDLALQIIRDPREDSSERDQLIKQAALAPKIHSELWKRFQGTASDGTMAHFLRNERNFTDSATDELIKEFRATAAFAKLTASDTLSDENGDSGERGDEESEDGLVTAKALEPATETDTAGAITAAPPPIQLRVRGRTVTLRESEPLTADEWDQMIEILRMLRPDS